ncbi:hypothetical protein LOTGIDRAFT_161827 [Lottia gigantea]|uniref:SUEL-type lectin domain-containing protein n=1 Tax=Lottia gigantea TaxID=225164 RepID=V4BW11_LOTGI|nr:hypothetical protein LOTGIDRAFT_161827 [Lottia gigantea]ESO93264.1 hypothetical protein LOTGIDRAFT_161827 [Lottia gigantea]
MNQSGFNLVLLCIILEIINIKCDTKEFSACYGTYKNFLELECDWGDKITIHKVFHGAKAIHLECPYPTDQSSYKEDCCVPHKEDCMFEIKPAEKISYETNCNGKSQCQLLAMWKATTGICDPKKFNPHTNFMKITYSCSSERTTRTTQSPTKTTLYSTLTTTHSVPLVLEDTNKIHTTTTSILPTTISVNALGSATKSSPTHESTRTYQIENTPRSSTNSGLIEEDSFAFTTGMMGGMVAAIIGLMLTIFGFIFYWGRKRRHLTMTKPQSSVWDFLLAQNITFRPFRRGGYDNFNSHRSSISSDGETSSPVTRKSNWTPNIAVETVNVEPTTSDDNCSIVDVHRHV